MLELWRLQLVDRLSKRVVEVERVEGGQRKVGQMEDRRKKKERQIEGVSKLVVDLQMELELLEERLTAEVLKEAEVLWGRKIQVERKREEEQSKLDEWVERGLKKRLMIEQLRRWGVQSIVKQV